MGSGGELVQFLEAPLAALARSPERHPRDPVAAYLRTLAPSGRVTVANRLLAVARELGAAPEDVPWHRLDYDVAVALLDRMRAQALAPATINLTLAALRGVARHAVRLGLMDAAALAGLREVRPVRNDALPAGRSATGGELAALLAGCLRDGTPIGARDGALLAVAYAGGLRRAELVALDVADWDRERGELRVLHGKGGRQRMVYPAAGAVAALDDWLAVRGAWPGPLFVPVTKGGKVGRRALNPQTVYDVLVRRTAVAGVEHLSPHDLRRTFAGDLLDAGADLSVTQKLLGHASPVTSARYDRRGARAAKAASELLHVPYGRRRG